MISQDIKDRFEELWPRFLELNAPKPEPKPYVDFLGTKPLSDVGFTPFVRYRFKFTTLPPPPKLFEYPKLPKPFLNDEIKCERERRVLCFERAIQRGFPCKCGNHTREQSVAWCSIHVAEGKECVCGDHLYPRTEL